MVLMLSMCELIAYILRDNVTNIGEFVWFGRYTQNYTETQKGFLFDSSTVVEYIDLLSGNCGDFAEYKLPRSK